MHGQVVAIVTVVVELVGLCVVKEITSPRSYHHSINVALCKEWRRSTARPTQSLQRTCLYLVAPISLVLLNPLGFMLMEIGKWRQRSELEANSSGSSSNKGATGQQVGCKLALCIAIDVLLNPIVLMTTLGIVGNFVFSHTQPTILEGILKVLGQSFSATALFFLGLRMVGKVQTLKGSGLVVPGILIATKTLILPLVTREVVSLLQPGATSNDTVDFSNYGFLYSTFSTAPGVFVFATQYNVAVDLRWPAQWWPAHSCPHP